MEHLKNVFLWKERVCLGGGNSNIVDFHPENWGSFPFPRAYFSDGLKQLKPPTRFFFPKHESEKENAGESEGKSFNGLVCLILNFILVADVRGGFSCGERYDTCLKRQLLRLVVSYHVC